MYIIFNKRTFKKMNPIYLNIIIQIFVYFKKATPIEYISRFLICVTKIIRVLITKILIIFHRLD